MLKTYFLTKKTFFTQTSILTLLLIQGCSRIEERSISPETQAERCQSAKQSLEWAEEIYDREYSNQLDKLPSKVSMSNLDQMAEAASDLVIYEEKRDEAKSSANFWCNKVKPNSKVYAYKDYIYLTREEAEEAKEEN